MKKFFIAILIFAFALLTACTPLTTTHSTEPEESTEQTESTTETKAVTEDTAQSTDETENTEKVPEKDRCEAVAECPIDADMLFVLKDGDAYTVSKDGKYGLVKTDGTLVHPAEYMYIGICPFHGYYYSKEDGDYLMSEDYTLTDEFHGGHGAFGDPGYIYYCTDNSTFYALDGDFGYAVKITSLEKGCPFVEVTVGGQPGDGIDLFEVTQGGWGMVNSSFEIVVDPIYEAIGAVGKYATAFYNGEKFAYFTPEGEKIGNFDFTYTRELGNEDMGVQYIMDGFNGEYVAVKTGSRCGIMGRDGNYLVFPEYDAITAIDSENCFWAKKDGVWTSYKIITDGE